MPDYTITVQTYGLDLSDEELDALYEIYEEGDVDSYFSEEVIALVRNLDGDIIGGMTESGGDELALAVASGWRGQGIGTAMIKAFLEAGGCGFMVAGTEAGSSFLLGLPSKLGYFPEELDVPCWEMLEEEKESC